MSMPGRFDGAEDWHDDPYGDDQDNDYDDDDDIARMYMQDALHRDAEHDGGECDCGPGLAIRLKWRLGQFGRRVRFWRFRHALSDEAPF